MNIEHRGNLFIILILLAAYCLLPTASHAQEILNEKQLSDLQTVYLDTAKNKKIMFWAGFEQRELNPENAKDKMKINTYKRNGKVPFVVWANCGELWMFKGGTESWDYYRSLSAHFYIINEKGQVIMKRSENLGKTAHRKGQGGYRADLPAPGAYTCVVYVKKDGMLFGKKITTTFKGYK